MRSAKRLHQLYYVLALLVLPGVVFAAGAPAATSTVLENGLNVIVLEDHSADLVAVEVWVKAGNLYETKANNGVAH